jgi:Holliday junction DNA helicase RuvA
VGHDLVLPDGAEAGRIKPFKKTVGPKMIECLRGTLLEKEAGWALLEVGGVGYGLEMPTTAVGQLPETGAEVRVHTHLHTREDTTVLFGFITPEEREAFRVFIRVSGIGPKTALGILSAVSIGKFAQAIVSGDVSALTRIPGIGKKTAERIIVEMKDRVGALPQAEAAATAPSLAGAAREACEALIALGRKPAAAENAVLRAREILGADSATEDLIREALKPH